MTLRGSFPSSVKVIGRSSATPTALPSPRNCPSKQNKFGTFKKSPYLCIPHRGVEQSVARRAHNPEVVGSSPASATKQASLSGLAFGFRGGSPAGLCPPPLRSAFDLRITSGACTVHVLDLYGHLGVFSLISVQTMDLYEQDRRHPTCHRVILGQVHQGERAVLDT